MMRFSTEAKVGLFAIAAALLLIVASQRTSDLPAGTKNGYRLHAIFNNISGITKHTAVEIAGVQVGVVEALELAGDNARLRLLIKPNVELPLDSRVLIQPKGVLGDKVVAIVPGVSTATPTTKLQDGMNIATGDPPPDFNVMVKRVDSVSQDIQNVTAVMRDTLGSEEAQERIQAILYNIETFSADLAEATLSNREALYQIVENVRILSEEFRSVIAKTNEGVDDSFDDLEKAAEKLNTALASVNSIAKKVDSGSGTLGRLLNDETTVEGLNTAVEGVNDIVERVNRIKVFVDYHGEALAFNSDMETQPNLGFKNYLGLRVQPHPDYHYMLELVDDPDGITSTTQTTFTEIDSLGTASTHSVTEQKTTDQFKFSVQFARRLSNATFRLGIKESTGGLGLDYHLANDRFHLSFDLFNFDREDENPNLKFMARYDIKNHLFFVLGSDDVVSRQEGRGFFMGAGLSFNDDDLKWVLGALPMPGG